MNKKLPFYKIWFLFSNFILLFNLQSFCQTVQITGNQSNSANIIIGTSNFHASEYIYTEAEIGASTFTTAASTINHIDFNVFAVGSPTSVNNFRLYLKDIPLTTVSFANGAYNTSGYTLVYDGALNATATGWTGVDLTTAFTRTPGNNLQLLIERADGVTHAGYAFYAARGNSTDINIQSYRRYNNSAALVPGSTSLTASNFRAQIQLRHISPKMLL